MTIDDDQWDDLLELFNRETDEVVLEFNKAFCAVFWVAEIKIAYVVAFRR